LKHWHIFIFLLFIQLLVVFKWEKYQIVARIFNTIGVGILQIWWFNVGLSLFEYRPSWAKINILIFKISFAFIFIFSQILIWFFDGEYQANGLLAFLLILTSFYFLIKFSTFPIKMMKAIELGKEPKFKEYAGY
jgi:hypothetical protein